MADQPMTLAELGAQAPGLLERYNASREAAPAQTPDTLDAIKGAVAPATIRPAFKPAVNRMLYGHEAGPAPGPAMDPTEQASAPPPSGGMGYMPRIDVPYYEGGADAEIARINAEYEQGVRGLESQAAQRGQRGLASPQEIFEALELEKGNLARERDKRLAQMALYKETPRGKADAFQRQQLAAQLMPYEHAQQSAAIDEATARDAATLLRTTSREAQRANDEMQAQARDYNRAYEQEILRYELAAQEVAKKRIDPKRWYRNQNTGDKILAIVGGFIGGVSASLNKTSNVVLDQINREVDRDIDAQEKDLQNERVGLAARLTVLGQMRQHFGDMRSAKLAAKAAIYDRHAASLQTLIATSKSDKARLRATQLQEAMLAQKEMAEKGLEMNAAAQAEALRLAYARARAVPQRQPLEWKPISEADRARYVPGLSGYAPDAKTAEKLRAADANRRDLDELLRRHEQLLSDPKAALRFSAEGGLAEANWAKIANKVRVAEEMGTLDAGALAMAEKLIPKAGVRTALGFGGAAEILAELRASNERGFKRKAETEGVMPATIERRYDDKGQLRLMTLQPPSSVQSGGGESIKTAPVE